MLIDKNAEQLIHSLEQDYFDLKKENPSKDEHWLLANVWLDRYGSTDTAKQKGEKLTKFIAYKDTWQFSILESPKSIRAFTLWLIYKELGEQSAEYYANEFSQHMELIESSSENQTMTERYKQKNSQTWKEIETEKDMSNYGLYGFFKAGENLDKNPELKAQALKGLEEMDKQF